MRHCPRFSPALAFLACLAACGGATATPTAAPTPVATVAPTPMATATDAPAATEAPTAWQTIATFTDAQTPPFGSHLPAFTVPGDTWRIRWTCTDTLIIGVVTYYISVGVFRSDGTKLVRDGGDELCTPASATGFIDESTPPGSYFVGVGSNDAWQVDIQVPAS